jgi:succinate dehydrogenase / fumarate reductase cytochrome b subunit
MALAINKENYALHKLHSLAGVIPVGYYLAQHLTLNTFSLAGPEKFNGVIAFFSGMPQHLLLALKALIWIPLIYHAVYGIFIAARAKFNLNQPAYQFAENRYFTFQRTSGILAFFFLVYHMTTTSIAGKVQGEHVIQYSAWADKLSAPVLGIPYLILLVYIVGLTACTYHFAYGLWSFCIRWGVAISDSAQKNVWRISQGTFVLLTLFGYLALYGFFNPILAKAPEAEPATPEKATISQQLSS